MQKFKSNITAATGAAIRNVPVAVLTEGGELASIFLDRAGAVPASNPLTTDSRGVFYFYAKNGRYSLRTAADGVQITDADTVLLFDPDETAIDGPIADAVRRAEDAAERAETALGDSGLQTLVQNAQNAASDASQAVADVSQAVASINTAVAQAGEAKEAAQAAAQTASDAAIGAQVVKDSLLTYSDTLSATPEWGSVPAHVDLNLDTQAQALANRSELLRDNQKRTPMNFATLAEASAAAATLPDGQVIVVDAESVGKASGGLYVADSGVPLHTLQNYAALEAYSGKQSQILFTTPGIYGPVYRDDEDTTTPTDYGTVFIDALGRRWKRPITTDKYLVNWWEADPSGATSSVTAFNRAIAFANATLNNDRSLNIPMTFGMLPGRYKLDASLDAITVSAVSFGGNSKHDTRLVITHSDPVFTFGDVSGARVPVGFSLHGCGIEYPADPTGPNAVVVDVASGHMPEIRDVVLDRIGTLMRLGSAADKIGSGASVLDVAGSVANAGVSLFNLRYGAGLTIDNARIFVRGVLPPVHPASMTTVPGTHVFKCDTAGGFWDTVQVSNSLFERFDIGIGATATAGSTYQNFFFTHVTMDYLRRYAVYASAEGGTISGINIDSTSWMCSWETDAIYIGGIGYNDNHDIRCQVPIAGGAGLNYSATAAKANKFSGFRVAGCNRLGTYQAAIRFSAGSKGFDVSGASGNHDTTGSGLPWRADYGIQIGANCDDYIVSGCRMKGAVAGFIAAENTSPSSARRVHNNVGRGYAGRKSAQTLPASGVRYHNTTPYVEVWSFFGGTITGGYDFNGVGIPGALTYLTFRLEPGDNFSVSYSSAPSILVTVEN